MDEMWDRATKFAQDRYLKHEHLMHAFAVADKVRQYSASLEIRIAALFHDLIEDTSTTRVEIAEQFNGHIAYLVYLVTDKEGKNRFNKHLATYYWTRQEDGAILVKMADRWHNHDRCIATKDRRGSMYEKEYQYFKMALYSPIIPILFPFWEELDTQYLKLRAIRHSKHTI